MTTTNNETNAVDARNEKQVIKAVANVIKAEDKCNLAYGSLKARTVELLAINGYDETKDKKHNIAVLALCKADVLKGLLLGEVFKVGDGSKQDKAYKSICNCLQTSSAKGRNTADENGVVAGTNRAPRQPETPKTDKVLVSKAIHPIELSEELNADMLIERDFSEIKTIADFLDIYSNEVFNYIASDEEQLAAFMAVLKNGKPVAE